MVLGQDVVLHSLLNEKYVILVQISSILSDTRLMSTFIKIDSKDFSQAIRQITSSKEMSGI